MEEKNATKISLSTFFLIISSVVIVVMTYLIFKLNNEKNAETKRIAELNNQISTLENTSNSLQEKINSISSTINEGVSDQTDMSNQPVQSEISSNTSINAISETINSDENLLTSNLKTNESSQNTISKDTSITIDEKKIINMISCVLDIKDFKNVDELKDEDYLYAVYRKIYILNDAEYSKHINSDGEVIYSVEEINSYVQELFNKKLSNESTIGLLKYKDGEYELLMADGAPISYVRNINIVGENDVIYATFDIYKVDVGDNEENIGTYTATIVKDKSTGNFYINSKVKK